MIRCRVLRSFGSYNAGEMIGLSQEEFERFHKSRLVEAAPYSPPEPPKPTAPDAAKDAAAKDAAADKGDKK